MKKWNSHDPELYPSQRKVSIGDPVSKRMPKRDDFSEFDYPPKKKTTVEGAEARSTRISGEGTAPCDF